ncbi:hypothetical protein CGG80_06350 [Vibrio parahaemolyticus]|nr:MULTISPECIES: hypothetical protein [Vibrio harveyi group]EGQ7857998.1 hypothetical protein [Vibrio parahaemolyticus]EGQ8608052.1 hypothetical protein [Vibrio parahaemolyticus]EJY0697739.1 hypothetical protein [Vibrio parahaemolyticus]EKZ9012619.1 hypothetical protein [Vibrio alginolyticus]ELB2133243.1 hypothetical protein [Vibrio parahaemolyticus]
MSEVENIHEQIDALGLYQGVWLSCADLDEELRSNVISARSDISSRDIQIEDTDILVLISQDCDLHNPNVTTMDVVVGKYRANKKGKRDVRYHKSRNYQRLVIKTDHGYWDFNVSSISSVDKALFVSGLQRKPFNIRELSPRNQEIILTWISYKYIRKPFPDGFNRAFLPYIWNNTGGFADLLEDNHDQIIDIYAYVYPEDEDADSYDVALVLLLDLDCPQDIQDMLEESLTIHCKALHEQSSEGTSNLNMLQHVDGAEEILNNVSYAQFPSDFSKEDELSMKSLTLNYLCWPDNESE